MANISQEEEAAFQAALLKVDSHGAREAFGHLWELLKNKLGFDAPTAEEIEAQRQAAIQKQIEELQAQLTSRVASPDTAPSRVSGDA